LQKKLHIDILLLKKTMNCTKSPSANAVTDAELYMSTEHQTDEGIVA